MKISSPGDKKPHSSSFDKVLTYFLSKGGLPNTKYLVTSFKCVFVYPLQTKILHSPYTYNVLVVL